MRDVLLKLVSLAAEAPSVHNVQPARWRLEDESVLLVEDQSRRLEVGDPSGHDAAISLGAAAEAFILAASAVGAGVNLERSSLPPANERLRPVARLRLVGSAPRDPLAEQVSRRASWRGAFQAATGADRIAVAALAAEDVSAIVDPVDLREIGSQYDRASYGFVRRNDFRSELLGWMRLSRRHPRWSKDGLNADAMSLSGVEAFGAGQVLGRLFPFLRMVGVAPLLLAEGGKVAGAAGVLLLHRPVDEDPFDSGRRFLRLWLQIEALGMGAAVLAALADDEAIAAALADNYQIAPGHRLVSAFRVGRRKGSAYPRARLPIDQLLV